jgi:hypothetical protein
MSVSAKTEAAPANAPWGLKRAVLHALILFHLAAVACWSFSTIDSRMPLNQMLRSRLGWYVWPTGFWQAWDMFAPNPATANVYLEADVTLADGSHVTWEFPRADRMGYFERYRKERYRKWATERVWAHGSVNPRIAQAAAKYAARQVERPGNPARRVELVRYHSPIGRPGRPPLPHYRDPPTVWDRHVFFAWAPETGGVVTTAPAAPPSATQPADGMPDKPGGGRP